MSAARCKRFAFGPADASATPSLLALTFLVPAYPVCPGRETIKRVCVLVSQLVQADVSKYKIHSERSGITKTNFRKSG